MPLIHDSYASDFFHSRDSNQMDIYHMGCMLQRHPVVHAAPMPGVRSDAGRSGSARSYGERCEQMPSDSSLIRLYYQGHVHLQFERLERQARGNLEDDKEVESRSQLKEREHRRCPVLGFKDERSS